MDIKEAVDKAIENHPNIRKDFSNNPNAANKLVGVIRKYGCNSDPKLVKKMVYEALGSEWIEKEKNEKKNVHCNEIDKWNWWINKKTDKIARCCFHFNECGDAQKIGNI